MHVHLLTGSPCRHAHPGLACPLCQAADSRSEAVVPAEAVVAALQRARQAGGRTVTLRDGDLLARPEALEILRQAKEQGWQAIEVWTHGLALAQPGVADQVVAAGATHLSVPLYGDAPESHDYVTEMSGHFLRTIAGLKRARAAAARTAVVAPLLRPSFRNLPQVVQKSVAIDVGLWRFVALPGPDRPAQPLRAPLALAGPYVRQALQIAAAARRRALVHGVPACLLGDRAAEALREQAAVVDSRSEPLPSLTMTHGRPCEACTWRPACPGVAESNGFAGLVARTDPPPAPGTEIGPKR